MGEQVLIEFYVDKELKEEAEEIYKEKIESCLKTFIKNYGTKFCIEENIQMHL